MQSDHFFHWLGNEIGRLIRAIVASLTWVFDNLFAWIDSFISGMTGALGLNASVFTLVMLILGLVLLFAGLRSLLRRRIFRALLWAFLGVVLLSWVIH